MQCGCLLFVLFACIYLDAFSVAAHRADILKSGIKYNVRERASACVCREFSVHKSVNDRIYEFNCVQYHINRFLLKCEKAEIAQPDK